MDRKNKILDMDDKGLGKDGDCFDLSTLLIFRCTQRKYAEQIKQGKIYFGSPRNWIAMEDYVGKGQGDILEGVFFSSKCEDDSDYVLSLKNDKNIDCFEHNGFVFFRKKNVLDLRCLCVYGLNNAVFHKEYDENGMAHNKTCIDRLYFSQFSACKNRDEYNMLSRDDQPVVVVIKDPHRFFTQIRSSLSRIGVRQEDIFISPVEYVNHYARSMEIAPSPIELFVKDVSFKNQSEIRVVISNNSNEYKEYMKANNNIIDVGSLEDIISIYDYYFDDMHLERKGNRSIMISLPEAIPFNVFEMDFFQLWGLMHNILGGLVKLDNVPANCDKWQDKLAIIVDQMYSRYGVVVHIDEDRRISFSNVSDELLKAITDREKKRGTYDFEKKIALMIENNRLEDALCECQKEYGDSCKSGAAYFYSGKIYMMLHQDQEAAHSFQESFSRDYMRIESLDGIAALFIRRNRYKEAIKVYQDIQDEIGYDYRIWSNIGICYIHLQEYEKAVEVFDKSIKKNKEDSFSYYNKAVACYKLKQYDLANSCVNKAIELDPDNEFYRKELPRFSPPNII